MSEQITMLMHRDTMSAQFTVNTALTNVSLSLGVGGGELSNAENQKYFQKMDNFRVLSIGCVLPLCFEFWNNVPVAFEPPKIDFTAKDFVGAGLVPIIPVSMWLPYPNYELNMGNFNALSPGSFQGKWSIFMNFTTDYPQQISMINVPSALNSLEFRVPLYMKVLHTLPMVA